MTIPRCDVLIFLGDCCDFGNKNHITDFMDWFSKQPAANKIFVAGNHDTCFEYEYYRLVPLIPNGVHFLDNQKMVLSCGENNCSISFTKDICIASVLVRMGDMCRDWIDLEGVDILVTHCPPYGILDDGYGSKKLNQFIGKYKPKYVLFGHNHVVKAEEVENDGVRFVNVGCG